MNPIRKLLALLLAVLWLPATAHCSLEAAGWDLGHVCADATTGAVDGTAPDCDDCAACQTVEHGYLASNARIAAPVPLCHPAAEVIRIPPPAISVNALPGRVVSGEDIGPPRPWQFAARAALLPRAPSSAS